MFGFMLSHLNRCAMKLLIGEGGAPGLIEGEPLATFVGCQRGASYGSAFRKSPRIPRSCGVNMFWYRDEFSTVWR